MSFWLPKLRKTEIFRKTFIKSKIFINWEKNGGRGFSLASAPSGRRLTHAPLGGRICPLQVFRNKPKTVADFDTKFGVSYPTSILHRMTKVCRNRLENFWEIYVFLWGHFTPILTKIGSVLRNSPKIRFLSKSHKKTNICRSKVTRSTKWLSWNFRFFSLNPHNLERPLFLGKS